MAISPDEVRHVARLARLDLQLSEIEQIQEELNSLLGHFSDIESIDVTGLEPQPHAVAMVNVWREDEVGTHLSREVALSNSAKTRAGLFIVPTIIEENS